MSPSEEQKTLKRASRLDRDRGRETESVRGGRQLSIGFAMRQLLSVCVFSHGFATLLPQHFYIGRLIQGEGAHHPRRWFRSNEFLWGFKQAPVRNFTYIFIDTFFIRTWWRVQCELGRMMYVYWSPFPTFDIAYTLLPTIKNKILLVSINHIIIIHEPSGKITFPN